MNAELKLKDCLALDRSRLASERTLMAWVRTAMSMVTFGFTIYKFLKFLQDQSDAPVMRPNGPRDLGLTLITIGTISVVVASVQHLRYMRRIDQHQPHRPWDLALAVAIMVAMLGILMIGSIVGGAGPFA